MINTKITHVDEKSYTTSVTLMQIVTSIVSVIIFGIITLISYSDLTSLLKLSNIPDTFITYMFPILIVSIIIMAIISYIGNYVLAKLYNFLLRYFKGIQFELTPHNEIKEVDRLHTSLILTIISVIWSGICAAIGLIIYFIILTILGPATTNMSIIDKLFTSSIPAVIIIITIIGFAIISFIEFAVFFYILNFYLRITPLKVDLTENEEIEITKIDITSLVMSVGLTLATISFITSVIGIFSSPDIFVSFYGLIVSISFVLISIILEGFAYNYISDKKTGIKIKITPSNNITREYVNPIAGNQQSDEE